MDHVAWLTLAHAYVSVAEYGRLLERFGDVTTIVGRTETDLTHAGLSEKKARAVSSPDQDVLQQALTWLDASDQHQILTFAQHVDGAYPDLLAGISGPPLLLYINGTPDTLHLPGLAIVGSRNPTRGGRDHANAFSKHLAAAGFCIVSGLAEGIDTAAHRGALDVGANTVACLGHGIDRVYPAKNRSLAHAIAESGALVSEYPIGAPPERHHFPERNRIISGLSLGTFVVEAARKSGSLITARLAAEQGREVFALPGSIHNPLARGCHALIQQGAKLVETGNDIVQELSPLVAHLKQTPLESTPSDGSADAPDDDYKQLFAALDYDPANIDLIAKESGLTIAKLSSMLLLLELQGKVEAHSGGRYALAE